MTTLTRPPAGSERLAPAPAAPLPDRVTSGLTVLAMPTEVLPLAVTLVRHGRALVLVPVPPDPAVVTGAMGGMNLPPYAATDLAAQRAAAADRALEEVAAAHFAVDAVETIAPSGLRSRLRALRDEDVACAVVHGSSARRARRLSRDLRAPVLAIPERPLAADGPAVLDARDAAQVLPAVGRALATRDAVAVAPFDARDAHTLARTAAHPLLIPRLDELAEMQRWDELDGAQRDVDLAFALGEEHGVRVEPEITPRSEPVLATARDRDGIAIVADTGGRRTPRLLREALRERRPALLVPVS